MANFARGYRFGRWVVMASGAPFLFSRFVSVGRTPSGWAVRARSFELTLFRLPR